MNKLAISLIMFYKKYISHYLGEGKCKFTPTCSSYAIMSYKKYNFFKATF